MVKNNSPYILYGLGGILGLVMVVALIAWGVKEVLDGLRTS